MTQVAGKESVSDIGFQLISLMVATPAHRMAAITRCRPNGSRNSNVPIIAANITLVSRSDETIAMSACDMAKITIP